MVVLEETSTVGHDDQSVDVDVVVELARRRALVDAQAAGHAEVHEQRVDAARALEAEQQVLAAAVDGAEPSAFEGALEPGGNRPAQAPVVHVDRGDALADERGRDAAPGGFDFGELGHFAVA